MEIRSKLIAKIHVAKKQLKIDDENYRVLLESNTGKSSCKDLDDKELEAMLEVFYSLGFKKMFPKTRNKTEHNQVDKIRACWIDLAKRDLVPDGEAALLGFVKRQTKVDRLEWLTPRQCNSVIEALKAISARH
jgi:phage gp16-like protein